MSSLSPIRGRRRSREQMDHAAEAPPDASSDGQRRGYRRVVTHHPVTVHGRTYVVEEVSFEPPPFEVENERIACLMSPYLNLTSRPESNRSRKRARVATSSDAILGLKEARAGDAAIRMPAECAVCLQDFAAEDRLREMPCSHTFHQDCIFRWLRVNHVCPLCRHALPTQHMDDEDEDYDQGNYQQYYDEECRCSRRRQPRPACNKIMHGSRV